MKLSKVYHPRHTDGVIQRVIDAMVVPLREVVEFLQPFAEPEDWQGLTFQATWSDFPLPSSYFRVGFRKDPLGRVSLRGVAQRSGGSTQTIGVLPIGYRPEASAAFAAANVEVTATGEVNFMGAAGAADVSLDGIYFDTR